MAKKSDNSTHVSRGAVYDEHFKSPHPPKAKERLHMVEDGVHMQEDLPRERRAPKPTTEKAGRSYDYSTYSGGGRRTFTKSQEGVGVHDTRSGPDYASKKIQKNQAEAKAQMKKMLADKAKKGK